MNRTVFLLGLVSLCADISSEMLYPVMPEAAKNIYGQIGLGDDIAKLDPAALKWGELRPGTGIGETVGVFPRIDKSKVMSEIKTESGQSSVVSGQTSEPAVPATSDEQLTTDNYITIDDFIIALTADTMR